MNPHWQVRTARLGLTPVGGADLPDLVRLKADPRVFALMLGGVRDVVRTQEELAEDVQGWAAHGLGLWSVRQIGDGRFVGLVGFQHRPDGLGLGLRFAFWPEARGQGLAREAAGAALGYAHDRVGVSRVVAVARRDNIGSRTVLGAVGMTLCGEFSRAGDGMVVYESLRVRRTGAAWAW